MAAKTRFPSPKPCCKRVFPSRPKLRPLQNPSFKKKDRHNIASGSPWEEIVGYSRAVRVGPLICVAGTTSSDENGEVVGEGDAGAQTRFILRKIEKALHQAGAGLENVVRTRMFVTDITQWEAVGRVHGEVFGQIKPVTTMVEVSALIGSGFLVEIEADAMV